VSNDKNQQSTTIITDNGTVIFNSTGPVHHGSGTQINIMSMDDFDEKPSDSDKKKK